MMEEQRIRPGRIFYVISALILIFGIVLFLYFLITGLETVAKTMDDRLVVPGAKVFELEEQGRYTIYWEYRTTYEGRVYDTKSIDGLVCVLKSIDTGEHVTLDSLSLSSTYSLNDREGKGIFVFQIDAPGEYELSCWYEFEEGEEAVLVVGKGFIPALLKTILLSLVSFFGGIGLGIVVFVFTLVKRREARNRIALEHLYNR
ncbi:MAG TPA: hypothetical protein PKO35_10960 [Candidatus Atribacteria bacterium]|nr:hypothetical protein [Candidatus Atribacteria bacterium]